MKCRSSIEKANFQHTLCSKLQKKLLFHRVPGIGAALSVMRKFFPIKEQWYYNNGLQEVVTSIHFVKN